MFSSPSGEEIISFPFLAESRKRDSLPDLLKVRLILFSKEPMEIDLDFRRKLLPCGIKMPSVEVATFQVLINFSYF